MDALKLFYEQQLGDSRRKAADRSGSAVAPSRTAEPEDRPERSGSTVAAQRAAEAADTPELLLHHLEQHAGQPLRSRAAIDAYFATLTATRDDARRAGRSLLRETTLVLFLVIAVLQYYYIDVSLQIAALKNVTVFVPVEQPNPQRASRS